MPKFRMTDRYGRTYDTVGRVAYDDVIEAAENPDPNHFEEVVDAPAKKAPFTPPVITTDPEPSKEATE